MPSTTRTQDAHAGGALCRPLRSPEAETKIAVSAQSPSNQPPRNAKPVGLGRGACKTSTAGMIVNGETAMTRASGMSAVSTEPQFPVTGSNLCTWRSQARQLVERCAAAKWHKSPIVGVAACNDPALWG